MKHIYMSMNPHPLENRQLQPTNRLYHRYGSQLGVASCDFVSTTPAKAVVAPKVSLACWSRRKMRSQLPILSFEIQSA